MKFIISLALLLCTSAVHAITSQQAGLIGNAGNTSVEVERYQYLVDLSRLTDLGPGLRSDLDALLPVVDLWANERVHWQSENRQVSKRFLTGYYGDDYPPAISENSPLFPIWAMYRGHMLIQVPIQSGGIQNDALSTLAKVVGFWALRRKRFPRTNSFVYIWTKPSPGHR